MKIRHCKQSDSNIICNIYNYYIKNTVITFEETSVTNEIISQRIKQYTKAYPWIVVENEIGQVVGYAYATQFAQKTAYKHSVEITVYLDNAFLGKGYGSILYKELLSLLSETHIHSVIAGI
ncbi:MAG: N-acetyltransferase family protein, partial [Saccharospirillaceae bacterium]|nr:N-acetyltransferase family protein [Pseudomonadales bacterium]NRB77105.1 N-acetyltransferase family protein [Saccharospirillaceae bacterium]